MYRRVGLDPTKTRPSNEALLRRVRRGDPFPRVNALVDAVNLCSLELQLPYGVYDRAALAGPIALRLGARRRGLRRDPQGHRARGRPAHRRRRPRPVRQPDLGFGAGDGDRGHRRRADRRLRAGRRPRPARCTRCSIAPPRGSGRRSAAARPTGGWRDGAAVRERDSRRRRARHPGRAPVCPKQFRPLDGQTLLERSLAALAGHPRVHEVVVALPAAHLDPAPACLRGRLALSGEGGGRRCAAPRLGGPGAGRRARRRPTSCWCTTRRGRS